MTMKGKMLINTISLTSFLTLFVACGPKPIAYVRIDTPKAQGHLFQDVALYYATEQQPEGAQIIEHIKVTKRSTNCQNATINALEEMQKRAKEKGGNALINLKAVWEGKKPTSNEKGFWCVKSKSVAMLAGPYVSMYGITWEGDIAVVGGEEDAGEREQPATEETPAASERESAPEGGQE